MILHREFHRLQKCFDIFNAEEQHKHTLKLQALPEGKADFVDCNRRILTSIGEHIRTRFIYVPMTDENNAVVEMYGCCWVVDDNNPRILTSAKDHRLNDLQVAEKELEISMMDKSNVVAYVFHEVHNPINALYLGLQAFEQEVDNIDMRQLVSIMKGSTEHRTCNDNP